MNLVGTPEDNSDIVNLEKLVEVQDKTYTEMLQNLMLYGECNVERPTGFGKTKLFMHFASDYPQERLLYIYDVNTVVADIEVNYHPLNVDFLSYAFLSRKKSLKSTVEQIVDGHYFAIIFDESHLMGGENVATCLRTLLPILKEHGCKILGGTATPIRTDSRNVTAEFFNGHRVFEYTISNAIDDGIMIEPMTVLMLGSVQRLNKLKREYRGNHYTVDRLNQLEHAYATRLNAPRIYRDKITELYKGNLPNYMRFIVFFPTIKTMKEAAVNVQNDFIKAFPKYGVGLTYISSDEEHDKTITHLDEAIVDGTIDIIASVDMLNQAYHSKYLNGIIMMRYTMSNIIYTQEYGRVCNVASTQRAIVFDNVGNACIDPQKELEVLFGEGEMDGSGGWCWSRKDSRHLKFHVSAEELSLEQALQRIRATAAVTNEFREKAKQLMGPIFNAPDEAVVRMTRLPLWFVQELRAEMAKEMTATQNT